MMNTTNRTRRSNRNASTPTEWVVVSIPGHNPEVDDAEYGIVSRNFRQQKGLTDRLFATADEARRVRDAFVAANG